MPKKKKGFFVTFEGGEGSGKDSVQKYLVKYLRDKDYEVISTKEPGGTLIGQQIRKILVDRNNSEMHPLTELLFYITNRNQNIEEQIKPALNSGKIIVSSRHAESSVAYQGAARKIGIPLVNKLNKIACKNIKPDIIFFLDVEPRAGLLRVLKQDRGDESKKGMLDRIESEKLDFHKTLRKQYNKMAKDNKRFIKIDTTNLSLEEVQEKVVEIISKKLGL